MARLKRAAHSAELDGFEAHPARGMALVMAADVLERMDALVGADGDLARCGRDRRHPGKIIRRHRLLKKAEAVLADCAHVLHCLVPAPALVGAGRTRRIRPEYPAETAGAFAIHTRGIDTNLDLERNVALRLLL